jgi:hypothetical protein
MNARPFPSDIVSAARGVLSQCPRLPTLLIQLSLSLNLCSSPQLLLSSTSFSLCLCASSLRLHHGDRRHSVRHPCPPPGHIPAASGSPPGDRTEQGHTQPHQHRRSSHLRGFPLALVSLPSSVSLLCGAGLPDQRAAHPAGQRGTKKESVNSLRLSQLAHSVLSSAPLCVLQGYIPGIIHAVYVIMTSPNSDAKLL